MGLFQDSLKKWFYTNNSSAASSDALVPLLNANGSPKGSDTMANLASVLGALPRKDYTANTSINDLLEEGQYYINKTVKEIANYPSNVSNIGVLYVINTHTWWSSTDNNVVLQYFVTTDGSCYRFKNNDQTMASRDWCHISTDIPAFYKNYANIKELASAANNEAYAVTTVRSEPVVIKSGSASEISCILDVVFFSSCIAKYSCNGTVLTTLYKDNDFSSYLDVSVSNGQIIFTKLSSSVQSFSVFYKITKLN